MSSHDRLHPTHVAETAHGVDPVEVGTVNGTGAWSSAALGPVGPNNQQADLLRSLNLYPVGGGVGSIYDQTPLTYEATEEEKSRRRFDNKVQEYLTIPFPQEALSKALSDFFTHPETGAAGSLTCNATTKNSNFGPAAFWGYSPVNPETGERVFTQRYSGGPGARMDNIPKTKIRGGFGGYVGGLSSNDPNDKAVVWAYSFSILGANVAAGRYPGQGLAGRLWIMNGPGMYVGEESLRFEWNFPIGWATQIARKIKVLEQHQVEAKCGLSGMVRNPGLRNVTRPAFSHAILPLAGLLSDAQHWVIDKIPEIVAGVPNLFKRAYRTFHEEMMRDPSRPTPDQEANHSEQE